MGPKADISPSPDAIASAFRQALDAADAFVGATAPNPPVGCAVLDAEGRVLAIAAHEKAGEGHAEARAIARCRELGLVEAIHTLVVTLEPCNHHGRTPPCAEAILATPPKAVWIGTSDPNGKVVGGGAQRLRAAGLDVRGFADLDHDDAPALADRARRLIAPFAKHATTGLPFVTVKQALDSSGSMIPPAGQKTFTSRSSLTLAHRLRRRADAILTGSGTVLADAPLFTVRHVPDFAGKVRHLAILDRRGRVPAEYCEAARERGFAVHICADLDAALHLLSAASALEVLVEAGPQVTQSILNSPFWDEHVRIAVDTDGSERMNVLSRPLSSPSDRKDLHVFRHH